MEGHQIQDSILVAHEVFHFLKLRKMKTKFDLAMNININKAYDMIEWDFFGGSYGPNGLESMVDKYGNGLCLHGGFFGSYE